MCRRARLTAASTWTNIPPDPWSQSVYCLYADPLSTNRLLVSDYTTLKISTNSGATYANCYTQHDLLIAGAFWDGPAIYVGTRPGLVVSTNGGASFTFVGTPGIPATEAMVSFAGAKGERHAALLLCHAWRGRCVARRPGLGIWELSAALPARRRNGLVDGGDERRGGQPPVLCGDVPHEYQHRLCGGLGHAGQPVVLKTVNGGASWSQVMQCTGERERRDGLDGRRHRRLELEEVVLGRVRDGLHGLRRPTRTGR